MGHWILTNTTKIKMWWFKVSYWSTSQLNCGFANWKKKAVTHDTKCSPLMSYTNESGSKWKCWHRLVISFLRSTWRKVKRNISGGEYTWSSELAMYTLCPSHSNKPTFSPKTMSLHHSVGTDLAVHWRDLSVCGCSVTVNSSHLSSRPLLWDAAFLETHPTSTKTREKLRPWLLAG